MSKRLGSLVGGLKPTAIGTGAGAATYFVHKMLASKVEFVSKHTFLAPAGLILAGHIARKRLPSIGPALVGAGGYALALAFDMKRQTQSSDTQALLTGSDVRALIDSSDVRGPEDMYNPEDAADGSLDVSEAVGL